MKTTMMILISLLSIGALASDPSQFSGEWSGRGVYQKAGVQTNCAIFEMKFDGKSNVMTFLGGTRVCDLHNEKFATVSMTFENGILYYNGQEVGTIKGNLLETSFSMPEGNGHIRHWRMSMRKEGKTIVYEESRKVDDEETPLISFAGLLSQK